MVNQEFLDPVRSSEVLARRWKVISGYIQEKIHAKTGVLVSIEKVSNMNCAVLSTYAGDGADDYLTGRQSDMIAVPEVKAQVERDRLMTTLEGQGQNLAE